MSYSHKERAIMELVWNGSGDLYNFCNSYFKKHKETIRSIAASNLRIPSALIPYQTYFKRTRRLNTLDINDILQVLPDSYIGPNYEEGQYSGLSFRSWHFVTEKKFTIPDLNSLPDVTWIYKVKAKTNSRRYHYHCLVEFVFAHPMQYVINLFHLRTNTKLMPIHHSFEDAKAYLDNQALECEEHGMMPSHPIWVDSKMIEIPDNCKGNAANDGEDPIYISYPGIGLPFWIRERYMSWLKTQDFKKYRKKFRSNRSAIEYAKEKAKEFNSRKYVLNCKSILKPFVDKPPPNYGGEHVVVILNLKHEWNSMLSKKSWTRNIPYVIFTR